MVLRSESGQRLFYLTCHVLFVHLQRLLVALAVLLSALILVFVFLSTGIAVIEVTALSGSLNVNALVTNSHALLFLLAGSSMSLGSLLLALLAPLFLRLLLGTSALVDGVKVYLALNLQLRSVEHLLLTLGGKDFRFLLLRFSGSLNDFLCLGRFYGLNGRFRLNGFLFFRRLNNLFLYRLNSLNGLRFFSLQFFFLHLRSLTDGSSLLRLFRLGSSSRLATDMLLS